MDALQSAISTLPPIDPSNADMPGLDPGKRQWEVGKTGFLNWARAQLIQHAQRVPGEPALSGASAEEENLDISRKDVAGALQEHERDN
jgi:kinetochore protein Mis12/MTW1